MHFNESKDAQKDRMMGALGNIGGDKASKKKAPKENNYANFAVAEESSDDDEKAISAYIDTLTKYAYD